MCLKDLLIVERINCICPQQINPFITADSLPEALHPSQNSILIWHLPCGRDTTFAVFWQTNWLQAKTEQLRLNSASS